MRAEVRLADWSGEQSALIALRTRVFIEEQKVPPEVEIDGRDPDCIHVVAQLPDGRVVGTGRLLPEGRIGRMAVDRDCRGQGIGRAVLDALITCARRQGFATVELHAQCRALGFYEAAGFRAEGPEFQDAGIPHRRMWRALDEPSAGVEEGDNGD